MSDGTGLFEPALTWLRPDDSDSPPPVPVNAILPVPGSWLSQIKSGDCIALEDTRGKARHIDVLTAIGD